MSLSQYFSWWSIGTHIFTFLAGFFVSVVLPFEYQFWRKRTRDRIKSKNDWKREIKSINGKVSDKWLDKARITENPNWSSIRSELEGFLDSLSTQIYKCPDSINEQEGVLLSCRNLQLWCQETRRGIEKIEAGEFEKDVDEWAKVKSAQLDEITHTLEKRIDSI